MISAALPGSPVRRRESLAACGGAEVLDLALCMILSVAVVGLLVLAV